MVTQKVMEALLIRTELALWKGRRSIYGPRRKALSSEYVLKKDVVDRMERSVLKRFSLLSGNYDDKLAKEKWEMNEAKKDYDKVVFYIEEGEKRIPELERQLEGLGTEGTCFLSKQQEEASNSEMGDEPTEKSLILWWQLVEEVSELANSITSFLEELIACIERSNNSQARNSELIQIQVSACEIEEKVNILFKRLGQQYGKTDLWKNIKRINAKRIMLLGESKGGEMQENAMLYTIQNEMEDLQKLLVETFAAMEKDGERLLEKLKRESRDGNLVTDERDTTKEIISAKNVFSDFLAYQLENQKEYFPSDKNKIDIQQKAVFPEKEFLGEENLHQEREALLEGIRLLQEELKSSRDEIQRDFKSSGGRLFGKYKMDFNEEEKVPEGIKKLEEKIEAWRKEVKEFRRKTRHFSSALDRFEKKRIDRGFQTENASARKIWYLTYLDELEAMIKTAEKQLWDFPIDI